MKQLIFLIAMAFCISLQYVTVNAQQTMRTKDEVFMEIWKIVESNPNELGAPDSGIDHLLHEFSHYAQGETSEEMREFVKNVAIDHSAHRLTRRAACKALKVFPKGEDLEFVRNLQHDENLRVSAAEVLISWGEWEEGSPYLIEAGTWRTLARVGPPELVKPILYEKAQDASRTPFSRMFAAIVLTEQGESDIGVLTARDVINTYILEFENPVDTLYLRQGFELAVSILNNSYSARDTDLLEAGLYYPHSDIRSLTINGIGQRALNNQDQLAASILVQHEATEEDVRLKERVRHILRQLNASSNGR